MTTPQILQPIPPGDGSGGVLPSSFAIGDILYADSTSTLKSLADVAVGSVLVSGGVGAAPAWSAAPSLTSLTLSGAGSASLSPLLLSGAILTGGTATTNFPALFIQPTGATAVTSWNTSGTGLGMNAATGFGGNFLDFHIAGAASLFKVDSLGNLTMSGDFAGPNAGKISLRNGNTILSSPGSAIWQVGAADAAAPVAQTIGAQNVVAGTSNTAGAVTTIRGSAGTGTGLGGNIVFQYAPHGSTGTAQNAFATALTINGDTAAATFAGNITAPIVGPANGGQLRFWGSGTAMQNPSDGVITLLQNDGTSFGRLQIGGTTASFPAIKRNATVLEAKLADDSAYTQVYGATLRTSQTTVAGLPSASTSGAGATAFVTDANATFILGLGLTAVGGGSNKVPVYSDGTNWIVG